MSNASQQQNSLLTGKNTGKFAKFEPSQRLHCLVVSVFRALWPAFPRQPNREFWARKQGNYFPEQGRPLASTGPSPSPIISANVKVDPREAEVPMLGLALLPIAHPIPRAPEHLGVSGAISDGLWRCPLYPRKRPIAALPRSDAMGQFLPRYLKECAAALPRKAAAPAVRHRGRYGPIATVRYEIKVQEASGRPGIRGCCSGGWWSAKCGSRSGGPRD
jgi:hypothetical protein